VELDLERDLPAGFFVSAAYVGSKGTHLPQYSQQINQISDRLLAQPLTGRPFARESPTEPDPGAIGAEPFFIDGQALALTGPTTTIDSSFVHTPSTPACNSPDRFFRQHLSLVPAHGAKAFSPTPVRCWSLTPMRSSSRHGHAKTVAGTGVEEFKTTTICVGNVLCLRRRSATLVISYVLDLPLAKEKNISPLPAE